MTDDEKESTIRSYIAAYNNFDIEGIVALVHSELIFQNVSDGEINAQNIYDVKKENTSQTTLMIGRF